MGNGGPQVTTRGFLQFGILKVQYDHIQQSINLLIVRSPTLLFFFPIKKKFHCLAMFQNTPSGYNEKKFIPHNAGSDGDNGAVSLA